MEENSVTLLACVLLECQILKRQEKAKKLIQIKGTRETRRLYAVCDCGPDSVLRNGVKTLYLERL